MYTRTTKSGTAWICLIDPAGTLKIHQPADLFSSFFLIIQMSDSLNWTELLLLQPECKYLDSQFPD